MTFEEKLKLAVPALLALPVMAIAYFQGAALGTLLADGMLPPRPKGVRKRALPQVPAPPQPTALAILNHNPFDHATDLDSEPEPALAPPVVTDAVTLDVSDPLHAERCAGVRVEIVTEESDPTRSVALLQPEGASSVARRIGDEVGEFRVEYIGFNRLERSPAVWLSQHSELCQVVLFDREPEKKRKATPRPTNARRAATKVAPKPPKQRAAALPKSIASRIEKVNDQEFYVDRSVVDDVLENKAQLMRGTRMIPRQDANGSTIALFGVRPNTLLGTLGLRNGDRIEEINGFDISDPEKALQAYARLRSADRLSIDILRRGKSQTIQLNLR
jgi:general secretion pathway protein C